MSGFLLVEDQKKRCSMAFFTALRLVLPIYDERTLNRINILSLGTTVIILNGKLSVVSNVSNHSALKSGLNKIQEYIQSATITLLKAYATIP